MIKGFRTLGTLSAALAPVVLLANCALFAPVLSQSSSSEPAPAQSAPQTEVMTLQDAQLGYASQTSAPPPGFVEVAEFRTREACLARGNSDARMVRHADAVGADAELRHATFLQFECTE